MGTRSNIEGGDREGGRDVRTKLFLLEQTLGATLTMAADYPNRLALDPGGANRTVLLPAEADGLWFSITNTADAAEILTVKEDSNTTVVGIVGRGQTVVFLCDGTSWFASGISAAKEPIAVGSALTALATDHNRLYLLDTLTGSVLTLPAATGSGLRIRVAVKALATSNSHKVQVTGDDIMQGVVATIDTDTAGTITGWATAADSDTVTLNRSTTGSAMRGEWLEFEDVAADLWLVKGQLGNTAAGATPFSAAVT